MNGDPPDSSTRTWAKGAILREHITNLSRSNKIVAYKAPPSSRRLVFVIFAGISRVPNFENHQK